MFVLESANFGWRTTVTGFDNIHAKLRENGCHSPTRESLLTVFKAVKGLAMLARLQGDEMRGKTSKNQYLISTEMLLQKLNGPDASLNISGNGYEFTGWFSEIYVLEICQFVNRTSRSSMLVTDKFIKNFCSQPGEDPEVTNTRYIEWLEDFHVLDSLRKVLIERINDFGLINLVFAGTYADRS